MKAEIKQYIPHNDLAIYDEDYKYKNENWYISLDEKYDDKELLQAIVLLR